MRRAIVLPVAAVLIAVACGGDRPTTSPRASPTVDVATPAATPASPPQGAPAASREPGSMPTGYDPDVQPSEIPPEALVPTGAATTGQWFAFTDDGVRIAIAWVEAGTGADPLPRGLAVWRRAPSAPHWRPAFVRRHPARDRITEIRVTIADVTGDRSDDALLFEGTGGTGACGIWLVIELLALRPIYRQALCDGRVEPAPPGEPGLVVTESVFRPGDAHCCPSAMRRTTLAWGGSHWTVMRRIGSPA